MLTLTSSHTTLRVGSLEAAARHSLHPSTPLKTRDPKLWLHFFFHYDLELRDLPASTSRMLGLYIGTYHCAWFVC